MSYDPRTIAFVAELLHPPQAPRADLVQGVHNALYRQPALGYQNFQVAADGIHLSNLPMAPGQVSTASFHWDRLVLREELRGTTVEDFATRVVNVATQAFQALNIQATVVQQFVVRSLIAPRHCRDGREFLAQRLIAGGAAGWQQLGRPVASLGLRLMLPAHDGHRETFQVRVESWPQDPRSLWLEVTGTYATPVGTADLPQVANSLFSAYRFLAGPTCEFLASLDTP